MDYNHILGQKIKQFRVKRNFSAESVANELGIEKSNYSRLENGKTEITIAKLNKIANFLQIPLQAFFAEGIGQSINITHGDNSHINHADTINNIDPFLINTLQDSLNALKKTIDLISR